VDAHDAKGGELMAEITKQFLTGAVRLKRHESERVLLSVDEISGALLKSTDHLKGQRAIISMSGENGRQYLSLTDRDIADLAAALIRCLQSDEEVVGVLRKALIRRPKADSGSTGLLRRMDQAKRVRTSLGKIK
jgi:hypothetical protein